MREEKKEMNRSCILDTIPDMRAIQTKACAVAAVCFSVHRSEHLSGEVWCTSTRESQNREMLKN
jgi:hypothetical protein